MDTVKSFERQDTPSPRPLVQMEVPGLEDPNLRLAVKSPEKRETLEKNILPPQVSGHPPACGRIGVPGLEEGKLGDAVKSLKDLEVKSANWFPDSKVKFYGTDPSKKFMVNLGTDGQNKCPANTPFGIAPYKKFLVDLGTDRLTKSPTNTPFGIAPSDIEKVANNEAIRKVEPFKKNKNVVSEAVNKIEGIEKEAKVDNTSVPSSKSDCPKSDSMYKVIQQRHLHVNNEHRSNRDPVTMRGNLSKSLKKPKPKLNPEMPEKFKNSEIFRMFERFRQKSELNKGGDTDVDADKNDKIKVNLSESSMKLGSICIEKSVGRSPKLKPKNRSNFQELRSIFEPDVVRVPNNGECIKDSRSQVKILNLNPIPNPALNPSMCKPAKHENNRDQSCKRVVGLQNLKNSLSPQSDKKLKLPSSSKKKRLRCKKSQVEPSTDAPITRFFKKKEEILLKNNYGESNENGDKKETLVVGSPDYN